MQMAMVAAAVANGGPADDAALHRPSRRSRRTHGGDDRAERIQPGDEARGRPGDQADDEARSSRRAPVRPPSSAASASPARPARPRSEPPARTSPSRGSSASPRPRTPRWRSRSRRADSRVDSAATVAAPIAKAVIQTLLAEGSGGATTDARGRPRHADRRPLQGPLPAGQRRHGRCVPRRGPAARAQGRAEAAAPPLRRGSRLRRALPARGAGRRRPPAPQRRQRL